MLTKDETLMLEAARVAASRCDAPLLAALVNFGGAASALEVALGTYHALRTEIVVALGGDPSGGAEGAPAPQELRVGLGEEEVGRINFGDCRARNGCGCDVCKLIESLTCACGCSYVDHPCECTGCTGFSLVTWLGGPPAGGDVARKAPSPSTSRRRKRSRGRATR